MRLFNGLAVAGLAGLAIGATHDLAEVYILTSSNPKLSSSVPQIPRQVARHILFQRTSGEAHTSDLPNTIEEETALSYILQYGKSPEALFGGASTGGAPPSQLVMVLEGVTVENSKSLRDSLRKATYGPAFTISDAPSSKANNHLVDVEFGSAGVSGSCEVKAAINPYDKSCWKGLSLVVKYDVKQEPNAVQHIIDNISTLTRSINNGDIEATLVLLPESSRSSKLNYWTTNAPAELRRRSFEEAVISEGVAGKKPTTSEKIAADTSDFSWSAAATTDKMNLGCFQSYNSCTAATSNCTGHGTCRDKYYVSGKEAQEGDRTCFVCSCLSSKKYPEKEGSPHVHWGGAYCQKIDVSSPFWLITGITVLLVGIVTGCIGLLFSVGEEKLPGVIGAGVSRSK